MEGESLSRAGARGTIIRKEVRQPFAKGVTESLLSGGERVSQSSMGAGSAQPPAELT